MHDGYKFMSNVTNGAALPLEARFWDMLLQQAKGWGVALFEEDWLASVFELMLRPGQDTHTIADFHRQLGDAAERAGIPVQYCMPLVGDVLQSVERDAVRFVRVSDDYCTRVDQWRIGRASVIPHALGLFPFKDGWWSVERQPAFSATLNECWNGTGPFEEPNPALQAAVAVLSNGPVAVGDAAGRTNATLVRRTCLGNGTLTRPARPALPIEATFLGPGGPRAAPKGEVWHTHATVAGATAHYVLCANLSAAFSLTPADLGAAPPDGAWRAWNTAAAVPAGGGPPPSLVAVDASHPLPLPIGVEKHVGGVVPFSVFALSPVLSGGWVFLGEAGNKFMPISSQRFAGLTANETEARVTVTLTASSSGQGDEVVDVRFLLLGAAERQIAMGTATCSGSNRQRDVVCVHAPPSAVSCTCA